MSSVKQVGGICKGKTLKGECCKKRCKKGCKYCSCHRIGGNKYIPPGRRPKPSIKASLRRSMKRSSIKVSTKPIKAFKTSVKLPKKSKYVPPHLRKKKSPAKKKSPPKKYIPVHLRPGAKLSRFAKMSPPKGRCVNYQHACKNTKYGNMYQMKCNMRKNVNENEGIKAQAEKCVDLRKQNKKCRIQSGMEATPKHDHAIAQTENNAYYCGKIIDDQIYPNKRRKSRKTLGRAHNFNRRY